MAVFLQNQWSRRNRPDYPLELNYSHPSNKDWLRFWEFGSTLDPRDIATRKIVTWTKATNYTGRARTGYGMCGYTGGGAYSDGGIYSSDNAFRTDLGTAFTAMVLYMPASSTNSDFIFGNTQVRVGGDYNWGIYRAHSISGYSVYHQNSSLTKVNVSAGSNTAPLTTIKLVTLTYDGSNVLLYVDGDNLASVAQTGSTYTGSYEITFNEWANPGAGIATQAGWVFYAGVSSRVWSAAEIKALSKNYWQLFKKPVSPIFYSFNSSSTDVNISLTGQNSSFSYGTLTHTHTVPLSGNSSSALYGTLSNTHTIPLVGNSMSASYGTISPFIGISVNLTGQSFTGTTGSLKADLAVSLLGQSVTSSYGTLVPSIAGNVSVNLSGLSALLSRGTLTASLGNPPETLEFSWANKKAKFSFKPRSMIFIFD